MGGLIPSGDAARGAGCCSPQVAAHGGDCDKVGSAMDSTSLDQIRIAIETAYLQYAGLAGDFDREIGLGGKLLYAGGLDAEGCALVRAANIAGAASLSASADAAVQRQAIREGVIDFLVNSLDEALRILKNEIRKCNAVAVGVSAAPELVAEAMRGRGVLPDLVRASARSEEIAGFVENGARRVTPAPLPIGWEFCIFADPLADFEARVLALIAESDCATRRWLRFSPRYLGPQARRVRTLACARETAKKLTT